jgi:hypothetical protein
MRSLASVFGGAQDRHSGRRSPDDFMLTAGGRAPPFGNLAKCATAAGADAGVGIQLANLLAWGRRAVGHCINSLV